MPSLEWNKATWAHDYDWSRGGEEWSENFGGSDMQWFGSLLPRIHRFIPAASIVEIAPGFGRWTRFLHEHCRQLTVVDLSETCLQACRARFAGIPHINYVLNDGTSLQAIPDHSVDFLFSFDSLVHVEMDVLAAYIAQFAAKLRPDGIVFAHHSNALMAAAQGCPPEYYREQGHFRSATVSAEAVAQAASEGGLVCPTQELWPLGSPSDPTAPLFYLDCITTFALPESRWDIPPRVLANDHFPGEMENLRAIAPLYGNIGGSRER